MGTTLQIKDLIELHNFYTVRPETEEYPHSTPLEHLRYNRALSLNLINEQGNLDLNHGKILLNRFKEKLVIYKTGVPWDIYAKEQFPRALAYEAVMPSLNNGNGWTRVFIDGTVYITNLTAIIAGKLMCSKNKARSMKLLRNIPEDLESKTKYYVDSYSEHDPAWFMIFPHTFCWDILNKKELVWFSDANQKIWIPLQAQYVKFVIRRFSGRAHFYTKKENEFVFAIVPPLKKMKLHRHVAACILPLKKTGDFKKPDTINVMWENKFNADDKRKVV